MVATKIHSFCYENGGGVYEIYTYFDLHTRVFPSHEFSLDSTDSDILDEQGIKKQHTSRFC